MSTSRLSRRSLLAATGASGLLLPLLQQTRSYGADPAYPLRILFVVTPNGTIEDAFWPTGPDGALALNQITAPLEPHKQDLLFTRGIDLKVWAEDNPFGGNGDAHHNYGSILTGTAPATGDPPHDPGGPGLALASSQSIDQYIGQVFDAATPHPFRTLTVRAWGNDGSGYSTISWTGDRGPASAEGDPRKLFDSLFSGVVSDTPDPLLVKLRNKRLSVLDYLGTAVERQSLRLGTEDRQKIQLHLDSIRNIERQLSITSVPNTCAPPSIADLEYGNVDNFAQLVSSQLDLVTAAFACGLTRVGTVALGDSNGYDLFFRFLDIAQVGIEFPERHHHDISHRPGENDQDKIRVENWFISQFAALLDRLKAVPEGDGSMFDNTVVLWMNSLNSGFSHTVLNLPMTIAAGKNVPIRTGGRVLDAGSQAHNKLLTALANAVGVPLESWGDPRYPGALDLT